MLILLIFSHFDIGTKFATTFLSLLEFLTKELNLFQILVFAGADSSNYVGRNI
jgi:hypothetical protein